MNNTEKKKFNNNNNFNNDDINNTDENNLLNLSYITDCIQKKTYKNILLNNLKISENENEINERLNNSFY